MLVSYVYYLYIQFLLQYIVKNTYMNKENSYLPYMQLSLMYVSVFHLYLHISMELSPGCAFVFVIVWFYFCFCVCVCVKKVIN